MEIIKLVIIALMVFIFNACAEKEYMCQDYEAQGVKCGYRP
ncbi:hypothetical protein [Campylobacter sputorum]|nr:MULTISPECIES: hypothetical protein [Campylobacter]